MSAVLNTLESLVDRQAVAFIGSVDAEGFPNMKAMLAPRVREVLEDAASRRLIWREGDTEYYPQGVDDPDYSVLRFTAVEGRYYSNFHSENIEIK